MVTSSVMSVNGVTVPIRKWRNPLSNKTNNLQNAENKSELIRILYDLYPTINNISAFYGNKENDENYNIFMRAVKDRFSLIKKIKKDPLLIYDIENVFYGNQIKTVVDTLNNILACVNKVK